MSGVRNLMLTQLIDLLSVQWLPQTPAQRQQQQKRTQKYKKEKKKKQKITYKQHNVDQQNAKSPQ